MKVKLIQMTQNPIDVMWVAARTCYSEKSPIEIWNHKWDCDKEETIVPASPIDQKIEKHWKLVKQVLSSGHDSIAQHVYFTFAIEGASRVTSHQIVRHRHAVFSQKSQRYVEIKEDIKLFENVNYTSENYLEKTEILDILDKYFVWDRNNYAQFHLLCDAMYAYLFQTRNGVKAEDARATLPNATKTDFVMSMNLGELMHVCSLRLCSRSQTEIRQLLKLVVEEVKAKEPRLAELLVPSCEIVGFCSEHQCCGRKPTKKEVLEGYEKYKGLEK